MKNKFTRVATLLGSLILLFTATVNAQSKLISFWDFDQTRPFSGGGSDTLGTWQSYAKGSVPFAGSTDSTNKSQPLFTNYSANSPAPTSNTYSVTSAAGTARILINYHPKATTVAEGGSNGSGGAFNYDYSSNHTYFGLSNKYFSGSDSNGSGGNLYLKALNPLQSDTFYLYLPTTGYKNIQLNYALSGSSTKVPAYTIFKYSTNSGATWQKLTSPMDTFNNSSGPSGLKHNPDTLYTDPTITGSNWKPININFTSDANVNNNSNFVLIMTYAGGTVTGTSGNMRYDNFSMVGDSLCPTFTSQPANAIACGNGSNASFSVATTGGSSPGYQWYVNTGSGYTILSNTAPYSSVTTNSLTITGATSGMNGYLYECQVTNSGCGTITSNSATLTVDPALSVTVPTFTNVTCSGNGSATASPSGGTSPYTYLWSNAQTSATATNLTAGTYTITVHDNLGCSASNTVTIALNGVAVTLSSVRNIECNPHGSATATGTNGTAPYTYSWSDAETNATATNLGAGTFTVTVQDHTGCSGSTTVTISNVTLIRDSVVSPTQVIHYWDFNNTLPSGGGGDVSPTFDSLGNATHTLPAPYTLIPGGNPTIVYTRPYAIQTGATQKDSVLDNGKTGSAVNDLHILGNDTGSSSNGNLYIRSRNPDENAYMYLYLPTNGFSNIVLNYAISASSTSGALYNIFSYSTNGGSSWNNLSTAMDTFNIGGIYRPDTLQVINPTTAGSGWYPININFSSDPAVNNNPSFIVRWQFAGGNCFGTSGNDRFDNISLSGNPAETCNGGNNVSATAGVKFGTSPYTYFWSPGGATTATASNLSAGIYTVTVSDANGCSASSTMNISQPAVLTAPATITANVLCNGGNNGSAIVTPGGGTFPYTYSWSSGETTSGISGKTSNTYTVIVHDNCNASATASVSISQPGTLVASISSSTNVTCLANGTATAGVTGGITPYTYLWSNSQTTATETNLTAGTYTVSVTDLNGCISSASVTITQPASNVSVSIASFTNVECTANGTATTTVVNGTSPYTYSWSDGETGATATALSANTFTVTVQDNTGCSSSTTVTISNVTHIRDSVIATTQVIHYWDFNNTLPVGGGGDGSNGDSLGTAPHPLHAPYTLIPGGNPTIVYTRPYAIQPGATQKDSVLDNGKTGSAVNDLHILGNDTGSASNGNLYVRYRNPDENAYMYLYLPTNGFSNIVLNYAISASSTSGALYNIFSYSTNGGSTWKNLTTAMDTFNIGGIYRPDTLQFINPTTAGSNWKPININFSSDPSVNNNPDFIVRWQFTGGASNGTSGNDRFDNISLSGNPAETCNGGNNVSATAGVKYGTSPYTYAWSPGGATTATASNLSAGIYTVTVSDANGCSASSTIHISQPAALSATGAVTANILCNGGNNGSATVTTSNGTFPYTYSWSSGETTSGISGKTANTYTVTVHDNCNASVTASVTITQPNTLTASGSTSTNVSCNGNSDGSGSVTASDGTSPYTYAWSNGATSSGISSLSAGTFTVNVMDNNGCSATASISISQPDAIAANVSSTNVTCFNYNNGSALSVPTGGTSPYTYVWSDANTTTTASVSNLPPASYTVIVTDANGCSGTGFATISQPATFLLANASTIANVGCNNASTGIVTSSPGGGTLPYTYLWSNSNTNATVSSLSAGNYSVTVTDNNGCTALGGATISQPSAFLYLGAGVVSEVTCHGAANGAATVNPVGGSAPYTYSWENSSNVVVSTIQSPATLISGTYTVTVLDNCGVSLTASISITQPRAVVGIISSVTNVGCNGGNGGHATVTASGGTYPYNYLWSPGGSTLTTASGLSAGTYTVAVTDKNGCTASISPVATITQPNLLVETLQSITYPECNAGKGSATVAVSGGTSPYTYTWTSGLSTTATCTKLVAGSYTITVKDKNSCTTSLVITMTQPLAIRDTIVSAAKVNVSCNGGNDGNATVGVKYGTAPYTFTWTPNVSTSATATGLSAGVYSITVTDNNGCSSSVARVTITQPATALSATIGAPTCTNNLVKATVTPAGGTSPYTYSWSPGGGTKATMSGLSQGVYTVTVTDAHGCSYTVSRNLVCGSVIREEGQDSPPSPQCCEGLENINLYPNPNNGQFTIQLSAVSEQLSVEIYNVVGQKIYTQSNIQNPTFNINISDQPNGVYLIRILSKDGNLISQKKIVKMN